MEKRTNELKSESEQTDSFFKKNTYLIYIQMLENVQYVLRNTTIYTKDKAKILPSLFRGTKMGLSIL
jgi:hypothetical protein